MSQLVSDRPASSRSGSSRLPSRGSSATACNCVRHSGTGLLARMLAFPSVEDKGRPRRWTVGSARFTTSLLALTASSAIELDRPSVRQVARHQIRLFSEHRGDARPNTLGTSACMTGGGEGTRTLEPPDCQSVTVPSGWCYSVPVSPCQSAFPLKSNAAWLCPVRLNVASMALSTWLHFLTLRLT
jgi:hypothetical protein